MNIEINNDVLYCPYCNSENLHQESVTALWRRTEDGDGERVVSSNGTTHIAQAMSASIPGRRHYIAIRFSCENCDGDPTLGIMQHKGSTKIRWQDWTE